MTPPEDSFDAHLKRAFKFLEKVSAVTITLSVSLNSHAANLALHFARLFIYLLTY